MTAEDYRLNFVRGFGESWRESLKEIFSSGDQTVYNWAWGYNVETCFGKTPRSKQDIIADVIEKVELALAQSRVPMGFEQWDKPWRREWAWSGTRRVGEF